MAWTSTDRDRLKTAIASGTLSVDYEGRRVTYRSMAEMREALRMIEAEIDAESGTARTRQIRTYTRSGF